MENDYIVGLVNKVVNNCDNLELLQIANHFIDRVVNDIELMNNLIDENDTYDLGNNYVIKNEDLESLISITETICDIENYNK